MSLNVTRASTLALSSPALMRSLSAREPSIRFTESTIMDFPAPVSPESTLNPSDSSILSDEMRAMFFMDSSLIIVLFPHKCTELTHYSVLCMFLDYKEYSIVSCKTSHYLIKAEIVYGLTCCRTTS